MSASLELEVTAPPAHVTSAFGVEALLSSQVGERAFRFGEVVLTAISDHARAGWSARVRETLAPAGFRVARPVRSSDGRYVISGWRADAYLEGNAQPRFDELIAASSRLHAALKELPKPRFLVGAAPLPLSEPDVYLVADRAAWERDPVRYLAESADWPGEAVLSEHQQQVFELFTGLAALRKRVDLPGQLVHGDFLGTITFHGSSDPTLHDLVPYWRPAAWGSALVVVDALVLGDADPSLPGRWAHLPAWPQMLLHALLFRLAVHFLHPRATEITSHRLVRAADLVRLFL